MEAAVRGFDTFAARARTGDAPGCSRLHHEAIESRSGLAGMASRWLASGPSSECDWRLEMKEAAN
jgi:hypothetical protein